MNLDRQDMAICEVKKITMGWETELYSFVLEFEEAGRPVRAERVIRLYSGNFAEEKALKEFKVMSWLFDAGYPVPEVFHLETDKNPLGEPFVIMEKIRGHNMMENLLKASAEEQKLLITLFVRLWVDLHNLRFPNCCGSKDTQEYIRQTLSSARKSLKDHDVGWLKPVLNWIDEHKAGVSSERLSLIHRDFHPNNVMLRDDGSPVVIDWGASTVGDYRDDLGWTLLLGITYLESGFREIVLETYQQISGRKIRDIEFFEVMAIFRRLQDVVVSITSGPEKMGMRAGAVELMKRNSERFRKVCGLLEERTGLRILELEQFINTL